MILPVKHRETISSWSALLAVFCLFHLFSGCATTDDSNSGNRPLATMGKIGVVGRMTDYGLYRIYGDPYLPGYSVRHLKRTERVPGVLNTQFGFSFLLEGLPPFASTNVFWWAIHPAKADPERWREKTRLMRTRINADQHGRAAGFVVYSFHESTQIVPGHWTLTAIGGDKLLKKNFLVITPAP